MNVSPILSLSKDTYYEIFKLLNLNEQLLTDLVCKTFKFWTNTAWAPLLKNLKGVNFSIENEFDPKVFIIFENKLGKLFDHLCTQHSNEIKNKEHTKKNENPTHVLDEINQPIVRLERLESQIIIIISKIDSHTKKFFSTDPNENCTVPQFYAFRLQKEELSKLKMLKTSAASFEQNFDTIFNDIKIKILKQISEPSYSQIFLVGQECLANFLTKGYEQPGEMMKKTIISWGLTDIFAFDNTVTILQGNKLSNFSQISLNQLMNNDEALSKELSRLLIDRFIKSIKINHKEVTFDVRLCKEIFENINTLNIDCNLKKELDIFLERDSVFFNVWTSIEEKDGFKFNINKYSILEFFSTIEFHDEDETGMCRIGINQIAFSRLDEALKDKASGVIDELTKWLQHNPQFIDFIPTFFPYLGIKKL